MSTSIESSTELPSSSHCVFVTGWEPAWDKVLCRDLFFRRQDCGAFHFILEFSDVPGPWQTTQKPDRIVANSNFTFFTITEALKKMLNQQRNVFATFVEIRHANADRS